jgi:hypothetical protein
VIESRRFDLPGAMSMDALAAHEDTEWREGGDHAAAVRKAPETELPISDRARQILMAMKQGWRGH